MELKADFMKRYRNGMSVRAQLDASLAGFSITVLFGPSGCGKTTILRCLAGLERPDEGHIRMGPETWFTSTPSLHLPAHRRRIGFVFQESALFPHLDAASNIAFGIRHLAAEARHQRVVEMMALVGLEGLAKRRPAELSGGQRQRVALARAMAPAPRLLLLDEPFAALDRGAREQLRASLRDILAETRTPTLLVTHDGGEALSLGDRFLMMQEGVLEPRPVEAFQRKVWD